MYFSTSRVQIVGGVPFGAGGGFGRGFTDDENLCLGALASIFAVLLFAADVESVDDRRAQICWPRARDVVGRAVEPNRRSDDE